MNPAATATEVEDIHEDRRWIDIHQRYVGEANDKEPEVVFIGDSLIQSLEQSEIWEKKISQFHCLNFGIGGDTTQNVLWRLENGELDFTTPPKVIILLCGTNNHGHTPEQVVAGLEAILRLISEKQPQAAIIILTIPPRGHKPNPVREKNAQINSLLHGVVPNFPKAQLFDIDKAARFVQSDGTINHHDMYDYLHLTKIGYWKAFEPVYELLEQILITDKVDEK
ncbi:PREDICTED: platelet-activating factor acetylhydrolase IB subunit gamma-like [Priapulus caudatus]|uniref:Platelet-activating factor acetylhydrolase IB subunit gamma-like n=1 Tax=Priapulus caudatus TaxID=37621 RepID=A0ABM1E6D3_PRICU|nr:PREDICTED: platelet-activating factor acetylhydrolase IB subunit gamma-like [Priapulus caudatus]